MSHKKFLQLAGDPDCCVAIDSIVGFGSYGETSVKNGAVVRFEPPRFGVWIDTAGNGESTYHSEETLEAFIERLRRADASTWRLPKKLGEEIDHGCSFSS